MKTKHAYIKIGLLLFGAAMFTIASARADTYSWTNLQSGDDVYFTAGISDEEHGLFGLITEEEN